MNSQHFSNGKISHLGVASVPGADLRDLDLDATPGASIDGETSVQHIPLVLEYNDAEDWYWRYGQERLYGQFRPVPVADGPDPVDWSTLQRFVTSYAWIEGRWRFILDKPCWMLHADVVDRVVMLYQGRKSYEEHRGSGEVKSHAEFLDLLERVVKDVGDLLSHCEIKTVEGKDGKQPYLYVRHSVGEHVRAWIPTLLHRVLRWEGRDLPKLPVMDAARSAKAFAYTMGSLGDNADGDGGEDEDTAGPVGSADNGDAGADDDGSESDA